MAAETHSTRVSLYGRLANDLTRRPLGMEGISVSLEGDRRRSLLKPDGYFVFTDLEPSTTAYRVRRRGRSTWPTRVTSLAEFQKKFGGPIRILKGMQEYYLYYAARQLPSGVRTTVGVNIFDRGVY